MHGKNHSTRRVCGAALLALGLSSALLGGCGGGEVEKGLVPVSGRVSLDGGPWPKPGTITFVPTSKPGDSKNVVRSATASFDTDGNFTVVGGYGGAKGLHPGSYWVAVDCPEGEPEMPLPGKKAQPAKNYAPSKYQSPESSGLTLQVAEGQSVGANFDVKSR